MPKDDISRLYDEAEAALKARRPPRQDTLVDIPPPAAGSAPRPPARVPRPDPKPVPLPTPELDSAPFPADAVIPAASDPAPKLPPPLPSTYPDSEAPTRVDGKRRGPPPGGSPSLSAADEAQARATRQWHPPGWLVAVAKWAAPPVMLCLMAGAYWFQAKVTLVKEQADALSEARKKKDADYMALQKQYAESQAKLGLAQAERDAALAQAAREHLLCSQGSMKIVHEAQR